MSDATDPYFPSQPAAIMRSMGQLRRLAETIPDDERMGVYQVLSDIVPGFVPTRLSIEDEWIVAAQEGELWQFPRPLPPVKLTLLLFGYEEWLRRKYCLPGFVEVKSGDVVIDCGAYVGGFARSASRVAGRVLAFEPEPRNFLCLAQNLAPATNCQPLQIGLYDRSGEMALNLSDSSVEHSLLAPDHGQTVGQQPIEVARLDEFAGDACLSQLDFVKVEAEGVEIEVVDGLGDLRPDRIAIDVSPERDGQSPADELRGRLEAKGYEVRHRGQVLFARRR